MNIHDSQNSVDRLATSMKIVFFFSALLVSACNNDQQVNSHQPAQASSTLVAQESGKSRPSAASLCEQKRTYLLNLKSECQKGVLYACQNIANAQRDAVMSGCN